MRAVDDNVTGHGTGAQDQERLEEVGSAVTSCALWSDIGQFPSKTVNGTDKLQNARSEMCLDILT